MSATPTPLPDEGTARWQLAMSGLMIALGGLLLGLQVDGNSDLVGTGYTALGIGGLVALVATLVQASIAGRVPRDPIAGFSALCAFFGLTFIVAGVLAPGGTWMFFEVLLLFWLLARRRERFQPGGPKTVWRASAFSSSVTGTSTVDCAANALEEKRRSMVNWLIMSLISILCSGGEGFKGLRA